MDKRKVAPSLERMARGKDQNKPILVDFSGFDPFGCHRQSHDSQVDFVRDYQIKDPARDLGKEPQLDARILLDELAKNARKQVEADGVAGPPGNPPTPPR